MKARDLCNESRNESYHHAHCAGLVDGQSKIIFTLDNQWLLFICVVSVLISLANSHQGS